jgi:hypothetical protein
MAGLLNLIPRYLPRFGTAPAWARASRPLAWGLLAVAFTVTRLFHANVDAQGGAYATGVLVLMTSAALAVVVSIRQGWIRLPFLLIALVFIYTTTLNIYERPEGIKIASFFILTMIVTSLISRAFRSTELRIHDVRLDDMAQQLLAEDEDQVIHIVARKPQDDTPEKLDHADQIIRYAHNIPPDERIYFFEVHPGDASEFESTLYVKGYRVGKHSILYTRSPVVANAIAAMLIHLEHQTGRIPHAYFSWTEGNPIGNLFKFLFLGSGDTPPLVHEVLRRAIPDPRHRPIVHVS